MASDNDGGDSAEPSPQQGMLQNGVVLGIISAVGYSLEKASIGR